MGALVGGIGVGGGGGVIWGAAPWSSGALFGLTEARGHECGPPKLPGGWATTYPG